MPEPIRYGDAEITRDGHVAIAEIRRPPNNFFDVDLINALVQAFHDLDNDPECRAIVLCSEGKHFCAGNDFSRSRTESEQTDRKVAEGNPLYSAAVDLFACKKPVIGAIQGAAVGGGFGLALVPDFRVVCPEAPFTANFVKLGFHPGFGLTHTLPKLIGQQKANNMFLTGKRIDGETAHAWGLGDLLTDRDSVRAEAVALASEIAENAPLAVLSVRATMRAGLAQSVKDQTDHEFLEQHRLQQTEDHREGVRAVAERRAGNFTGR